MKIKGVNYAERKEGVYEFVERMKREGHSTEEIQAIIDESEKRRPGKIKNGEESEYDFRNRMKAEGKTMKEIDELVESGYRKKKIRLNEKNNNVQVEFKIQYG
jgi:DNA-binding transcriptional regulator YhcF (GntR family)